MCCGYHYSCSAILKCLGETSDRLCVSLCAWESNDNITEGNKWTLLVV